MKVALWAEIRRLAEIEKLSGWAISRQLHCSRHTVAAALKLEQPPHEAARRNSLLDTYRAKIDALLAKYPELSAVRIREEIARGPDGYSGSARIGAPLPAEIRPARSRVSTRKLIMSRARRCKSIGDHAARASRRDDPQSFGLRGRALLQPADLYRIHPLATQGRVLSRNRQRSRLLRRQSPRHHLRQPEGGGDQWLGPSACFHPEFLALCGYFCLQPIACERRDPESKGIVEGSVRYIKHNALAGRADELVCFEDYLALGTRLARSGRQCADT